MQSKTTHKSKNVDTDGIAPIMNLIDDFLAQYAKKKTRATYRSAAYMFLDSVYGDQRRGMRATHEEGMKYEELAKQYVDERQSLEHEDMVSRVQKDIIQLITVKLAQRPPKTGKSFLSAVKEFLNHNRLELTEYEWKVVKRKMAKGSYALTVDRAPTGEELRRILMHASVMGRALFLLLASSGMSVDTALKLKKNDINLQADPMEIAARRVKVGSAGIIYASDEAKEALTEWLKVRDSHKKKGLFGKDASHVLAHLSKDDPRKRKLDPAAYTDDPELIFTIGYATARRMWNGAVEKSGLVSKDSVTHRHVLHIHSLRKFFRSKLGPVNIDYTETLMQHTGYLSGSYRRFEQETLRKFFKDNMHLLSVYASGELTVKLTEMKNEFKEDMQKQARLTVDLQLENNELRKQVRNIETYYGKEIDSLKKVLYDLKPALRPGPSEGIEAELKKSELIEER